MQRQWIAVLMMEALWACGMARYRRHTHPTIDECKPKFSEISTLYLGTNSQSNGQDFDEFIEIAFPEGACRGKELVLRNYYIMAVDMRPKTSYSPALLFYGSLYHKKMRRGTRFFVIGNQTEPSKIVNPIFDVEYGEQKQDLSAYGISHRALHRTRGLVPLPSEEENSHYPVVFMILERCSLSNICSEMKDYLSECSYMQEHSGRRMERKKGDFIAYVADSQIQDLIFEHVVDVVVISRNESVTLKSSFVQRLENKLKTHNIKLGMVALSVSRGSRDIPRGSSISYCPPPEDEVNYQKTHTSLFWQLTTHTPGTLNDCVGNYLRRFDESVGYNANVDKYEYAETQAQENHRNTIEANTEDDSISDARNRNLSPVLAAVEDSQADICLAKQDLEYAEECEPVLQKPPFTHAEFQSVAEQINFLYLDAVGRQKKNHEETLKNARESMQRLEESTKKNALRREMKLILSTGDFDTEVSKEVLRLAGKEFEYYTPVFGTNWRHGKRNINIRCEPCFEATHGGSDAGKSGLAKEGGVPITKDIVKTLRNHQRRGYTAHENAVKMYNAKIERRISDYLATVDASPSNPVSATSRLFSLVYSAVKMYLPPYEFPRLCETVDALGVEIGTKHRTQEGYVSIANLVSDSMRNKLVEYIRKNQPPFSLLIDGSTDSTGKQIILIFIRFPDMVSLSTNTQFFEAVELNKPETGDNLLEVVYEVFARNGLIRELNWNLVAVATDGASNMAADGGLQGKLNANISQARKHDLLKDGVYETELHSIPSKPIVWIHCLAHKVELALAEGLKGREFSSWSAWRSFTTKYLNKLRMFFGTISTKRRRVLQDACFFTGLKKCLKLKEIIDIRWTSSEREALSNFLQMYKPLWKALEDITQKREEFDPHTRTRAAAFLLVLKSIKFYRYIVYQLELLKAVGDLSRKAQEQSATIWATERELASTVASLDKIAESPWDLEATSDFQKQILCKRVHTSGTFHLNAKDDDDCRNWFWIGWENERRLNKETVEYRLADNRRPFLFSVELPEHEEQHAASEKVSNQWEAWAAAEVRNLLDVTRSTLALHITRGFSQQSGYSAEEARTTIDDLEVVGDFRKAMFTQLDVLTRKAMTDAIAESLRKRLIYPSNSVLYAMNSVSPQSIIDYVEEADSSRSKTAQFFGFDENKVKNSIKLLHRELTGHLPEDVRSDINLSLKKNQYFLPILRKHMLSKASPLTRSDILLQLLTKIATIPTNTAEVERGFSVYNFIKEPRRSAVKTMNMDAYLRIVLNGPERPSPYEFEPLTRLWAAHGHKAADDPAGTRGPQKATDSGDEEYERIYSKKVFFSNMYFSEP